MKKFIYSALAAGALAFGSAASAQDLGTVIGSILGFGQPTYNYGVPYTYNNGIPAVVAGTQGTQQPITYTDQYGRLVHVDQWGRHVLVQPGTHIAGYDNWGRPIYRNFGDYGSYAYSGRSWDRDGDGIANTRDRWPDNRSYW